MKIDWLLIILEFSVFTIPILLGFILSFRWFIQKRTYERVLFIVAFLFPIVVILSLIKVFYILELGPNESAFLTINLIFAVGISTFIYITILETTGKTYAKLNSIEIIGILMLILSSFLLGNIMRALDYISWGIIGIAIIHLVRGFAYSKYGSSHEKRMYVLVVLFSAISVFLKLLYYTDYLPLKPTIYISLTLMFLSFLHGVFTLKNIGARMPSRPLEKEIFKEKLSIFTRLLAISLIAAIITSIASSFGFNSYRSQKEQIISDLNYSVQNASFVIADKLNQYLLDSFESPLVYLAETLDVDNLDHAKLQIKTFYDTHKSIFASVTLMNDKGIIVYTYPYTYAIGSNISNQPHVKEVLKTKKTTLSLPFKTVEGFNAIAIHIPIFKGKIFTYTIAGLIDLNTLSRNLSNAITPFKYILSEDGVVCATNISDSFILKNVDTVLGSVSNYSISKSYSFTYLSRSFLIKTFGSLSDLSEKLHWVFLTTVLTYGLFILLFLLFYATVLYGLFALEKETTLELEETLKRELEALKAYKDTQEKLNTLNNFIFTTSIDAPIETAVQKLLETVVHLIPKIEKGVLWFVVGDKVMPVASVGYDVDLLKKLVLDKEREERFWKKPTIIEKIGISGFPEELRDYAKKLGVEDIKETLIIPITVKDEYMGHFSLDIFKEGVHFDEVDIAIANSVAKIISFYFSIQAALKALKKEVDTNASLASKLENIFVFLSKTSFKEDYEEFFSKLLMLTLSLIEGGEYGTILLRTKDELKYVASFGYDVSLLNELNIDLETEEKLVEKGKVKIIESIEAVGLDESQKELAKKLGLDRIKYTITASFFIEDEYYGGIFIDSTKDQNPFTTQDIEVMEAISNLGSLFLRTKKLFEDLENELKIDSIITEISKNLDFEMSVKNYFKEVFQLLNRTFEYLNSMKVSVEIENRFIHVFACDDSVNVVHSKSSEYTFEEEKEINNFEKIYYEIGKDKIEFGLKEGSEQNSDIINQLSVSILPVLKSFFIYKDRAKLFADIMIAFARTIDSKDPYTRTHSENVTKYAYFFARHLGLDKRNLKILVLAAILHDIGKIGVKESILLKNGPLTADEREIINIHPEKGYEIISVIEGLEASAKILRHHHERWDGKGYPDKLKGEEIPYLSRILSIVDAFDAMTTERPYRKALTVDEAMKEIEKNAGIQFDPELAKRFIELKDSIKDALNISIEDILMEILNIE
ncbi:MAG: HD domain-containing phosphohydrolase [Caldisericum sp.]|uniref:HD domain-containing phosphohydrolase n=1 Tax=Caldisericum sp. TaxID=2499687 RepID=UPI003D116BD1